MSHIESLKKATNLHSLAHLLGYKPQSLSYILYKMPKNAKYTSFDIIKKSGGKRKIKAPTDKLKKLQRHLATLLNECYDEIYGVTSPKRSLSHGYRSRHSIITNALRHKNKRFVFNIDIENFFPSINFGRVRGFFISNKDFQLSKDVATIIAQIACFENELPQGSPCSPVISNFIGHIIDTRMVKIAQKAKCDYTRYVDDITFSTNQKEFPKLIASVVDEDNWKLGKAVERVITKSGFSVNSEKVSMNYKISRQIVTGLVVNKKINVRREYYKNVRAMCDSLFKTGKFTVLTTAGSDGDKEQVEGTLNELEGRLSYIYYTKRTQLINTEAQESKGLTELRKLSITKLYQKFNFYRQFCVPERATILCEGKTDITYLESALKNLHNDYPDFIESGDENFNYLINIKTLTKRMVEMFRWSLGTSGLENLMKSYSSILKDFKIEVITEYPIIILVDNDDGSEGIIKEIKKKRYPQITKQSTYHCCGNLYVVIIPQNKGEEVEDLFPMEVLNQKIDGKSFDRSKEKDNKDSFAKHIFAEKIIRPNYETIDFTKFKPIFDEFKSIILHYRELITS